MNNARTQTFTFLNWVAIVATAVTMFGCRRSPVQYDVETETGYRLIKLLKHFEAVSPGVRVTNTFQLFAGLNKSYPHDWDSRFRRFGSYAGFVNSIYEKHVFLPAGITNRFVDGEIVFLNASPFPNRTGTPGRILVSKVSQESKGYQLRWVEESQLQQMLAEAGIVIPKPASMPPPPPPPEPSETDKLFEPNVWSRTADFFDWIAGALHLGEKGGRILQWWTITLAPVFSSMVVLWAIYRFFKRRKHG